MSYRRLLTLFFVLIVAIPMIALAVLVTQIASDSATGKTDARISAGLRTATNLFEAERAAAEAAARKAATEIAADPSSIAALDQGDASTLVALARAVREREDLALVEITDSAGDTVRRRRARHTGRRGNGRSAGTLGSAGRLRFGLDDHRRRACSTGSSRRPAKSPRWSARPARSQARCSIEAEALPESGEATDLDAEGEELRVAATEPLGDERNAGRRSCRAG